MKGNKITFETGATSYGVNELILFTDITIELTELRDDIYKKWIAGVPHNPNTHVNKIKTSRFDSLFFAAEKRYKQEFPTSSHHIIMMTSDELKEYCQLYVNNLDNWKLEHGYK